MMKNKSTKHARLKLLVILPILAVLLLAFSKPRIVEVLQSGETYMPLLSEDVKSELEQEKQDKKVQEKKEKEIKKKVVAIDEKVEVLKKKYKTAETDEEKKEIKSKVMALSKERDYLLASAKKEEYKKTSNGERVVVKTTSASYVENEKTLIMIDKDIEVLKAKYEKAESDEDKDNIKKKIVLLLDKKEQVKQEMASQDPPKKKKKKESRTKVSTEM